MNLIHDPWIPISRFDSSKERIAPWQLLEIHESNPIIGLNYPRPDFNGAITQFLIGLLQTCCKVDQEKWEEWLFSPPRANELQKKFEQVAEAFNLSGDGPRFMQDFDTKLDGKLCEVEALLIDTPGENTIQNNSDHFVKKSSGGPMCEPCIAASLFTLQTNAPSGGAGHRTSLRGGGPLTTLLQIQRDSPKFSPRGPTLFEQLWVNVLDNISFGSNFQSNLESGKQFPWMGPTRTSGEKEIITPTNTNPITVFWGMPRRIRLDFNNLQQGSCSVCGETTQKLVQNYLTKNYGENYEAWMHPLSPYYQNNEQAWLPLHPQPGGIGYRQWLDLTNEQDGRKQANVISGFYRSTRLARKIGPVSLWAFGYDMDNMKARGWHESRMPVFLMSDSAKQTLLAESAGTLISAAKEVLKTLIQQIKKAWFPPNHKVRGKTSFIDIAFWSSTEMLFFQQVDQFQKGIENDEDLSTVNFEVMTQWHKEMVKSAVEIFDKWTESGNVEFSNFRRLAIARSDMQKFFYGPNLRRILGLPGP